MSRVKVDMELNHSAFTSGVKAVNHSFEELKGMVIGAFTLEGVKAYSEKVLQLGSDLTNSAIRMGMTVEQVQVLKQAAKDSGTEFEKLQATLDKVSIAKAKALGGDKEALAGFKALGIDKQQLQNTKSVDLLFGAIADSVKAKGGESLAKPLGDILGRGFGDVIPLLKSDISEVSSNLKGMGALMSTDTAVKLKVLDEQLETIGTVLTTFFAPALVNVIEQLESGVSTVLHKLFDDVDKEKNKPKDDGKFWSNLWTNTKGVGSGLVGLGSLVLSGGGLFNNKLHDFAIDQIMKADNGFQETGFTGIMDTMAKQLNKGQNPADTFDKLMEEQKKKIEALTKQVNGGSDKPVLPVTDVVKKTPRIYSDSLTSVGNMLGASYQGIGQVTQIDLQKQANVKFDKMVQKLDEIKLALPKLTPGDKGMGFDTSLF